MLLQYTSESRTGYVRTNNEDSVGIFPVDDGLLAIVCDGIGGNNAGEVASENCVKFIQEYFFTAKEPDNRSRLVSAFKYANGQLCFLSKNNASLKGMATTAVAVYITEGAVCWAHVGDSRIYFYNGDGLRRITKDHSLVQRLLDLGMITPEAAENHPRKNVITRALGDIDQLQVDSQVFYINGDAPWKFFLCSDGVSGPISDPELNILLRQNDLDDLSDSISLLVEKRGAPDNFTFALISNSPESSAG